jgi:uncharacterized protein YndB with AHSA1/START domain
MLQPEKTSLLIADISGYTEYLAGVEIDHAQDILADLISTVVTALRPTFRLAKLEGDAAFCFAPAEKVDGSLLLDTIEHCYFGFRRRRRDVRQATSCECNACLRIPDLNLKFVAHQGLVIRQRVAGREELLGSDVIVVHRLLKNDIVEKLSMPAYAAISDAIFKDTRIDPVALGMTPHSETYEHVGEIKLWVNDLERRWQEEDSRQRVFIGSKDAVFAMETQVSAPPEIVWQYLNTPGRRAVWQAAGGVTSIEQDTGASGRRGVGTVNHCMHGPAAVLEEILDWRPFDYYSYRSTMPDGTVFVATMELEPTVSGTIVRMHIGKPKKAKDRQTLEKMGPLWAAGLKAGLDILKTQAGAETEELMADRSEPALPTRSASDDFLKGIQPIQFLN